MQLNTLTNHTGWTRLLQF